MGFFDFFKPDRDLDELSPVDPSAETGGGSRIPIRTGTQIAYPAAQEAIANGTGFKAGEGPGRHL